MASVENSKAPSSDGEHPARRGRVSLACQRCKSRKQKCDGVNPACSTCVRFKVECQYIYPTGWKPGGKKFYIRALENRVAQLETCLAGLGHGDLGGDHVAALVPQATATAAALSRPEPPAAKPLPATTESPTEEDDLLPSAIRDLSLGVNGQVLGGTSTITLGRLLSSLVGGSDALPAWRRSNSNTSSDPGVSVDTSHPRAPVAGVLGLSYMPDRTSRRLVDNYIKNFSTRFPVLHTPRIRALYENRRSITSSYNEAILHLIFALSGRFLELSGEPGNFNSDSHYEAALLHMDEILQFQDVRSVVYLILLGVHSIRAAKDLGAWMYVGLATRLSIDLGLHRRVKNRQPSLRHEMDKRIFWSLYYLDREVAMAMGRPLALSDNDIDAELPLDIDEWVNDEGVIAEAACKVSDQPCSPPRSLTSFIHHIRLKKIESEIQNAIYRVDRPFSESRGLIQAYYRRLTEWEKAIPVECRGEVRDQASKPYDSIDVYHIVYHRACRLLLYPTLAEEPVNLEYVSLCAEACGNVCDAYKRLHHSVNIAFAPLSLQNVFLAGLTLLYCIWLSPGLLSDPKLNEQLTNCVIMLYAMAERYPSARKYRDVFEAIKVSVTGRVSAMATSSPSKHDGRVRPRLVSFGDGVRNHCQTLTADGFGLGGARDEFAWIIGELSGGDVDLTRGSPGCNSHLMAEDWLSGDASLSIPEASMSVNLEIDFDPSVGGSGGKILDDSITVANTVDYNTLGDDWSMPMSCTQRPDENDIDFGDWSLTARG